MNRQAELMVQSVVTGCTAVMNRPLLELSLRMPGEAFMHDRWIGLLASFMGKSSAVRVPTVLYRQHENNVLGTGRDVTGIVSAKGTRSLLQRMRRPSVTEAQITLWNISQRDAAAFLREYGTELPPGKRDLLKAFLRCQTSRSRFVRIATFIRYGFYYVGLRFNLATMRRLWQMNADKR